VRVSLQIPSTERRVVGLCWEKLKPKGPKGEDELNSQLSLSLGVEGLGFRVKGLGFRVWGLEFKV
jgi:hypothetical protein